MRSVRRDTGHALVAMVSASIVHRVGPERFLAEARSCGFDGPILPDADLRGAGGTLVARAAQHGLTFTAARVPELASLCSGFVYLLARVDITGVRDLPPDVAPRDRAPRLSHPESANRTPCRKAVLH